MKQARLDIDEAAGQGHGAPPERLAGGLIAALGLLRAAEVTTIPAKSWVELRVARAGASVEVLLAQQVNPRSLAAAIRGATALAPASRVVLLRERALAIAPTWKEVDRCLAAFAAAPGAAFVPLDRDDVARLLALEAFVTAARSHDLSAADGQPHPPRRRPRVGRAHAAGHAVARARSHLPRLPRPLPAPAPSPAPRAAPRPLTTGPAGAALERLRVASVERLVREAKALDPTATRAAVLAELRRLPVRFFGDSIVALADRWP